MANMMKKNIYSAILRLFGWRVEGNFPAGYKKTLCIMIPHTSNWDFPLGILTRGSIGIKVRFIAKHTLFRFPFGWIFRALGGYPVNRQASGNYVFTVADIISKHDEFHIGIAPEGTRKKVDKLKTGFYFIAQKAHIPIFLVKFDFGNRVVDFGEPFWPGPDKEADFAYIEAYYKGVKGKIPENSFGL